MATPPDSPIIEEATLIELEEQLNNPSAFQHARPVALEDLCRQTKFTRQEIRVMYRGFKQVGTVRESDTLHTCPWVISAIWAGLGG